MRITVFFSLFFIVLLENPLARAKGVREEIRVPAAVRRQLYDLAYLLQTVTITPVVDRNDTVLCMEIHPGTASSIRRNLKIEDEDCVSEVFVFKKALNGKIARTRHSVLSIGDATAAFEALAGATRVEVDLKRKKQIVFRAYLVD